MATFNESRTPFKPYGLSCERWTPSLMGRPDRHNEIELNYLPRGSVTYLLQDCRITLPPNRLAVFWGLIAHQIVDHGGEHPYFVATLPFSLFLEWNLPAPFVERILAGALVLEQREEMAIPDEVLLTNWAAGADDAAGREVMLLELRARLARMALSVPPVGEGQTQRKSVPEGGTAVSQVEQIAFFIAQNFRQPIRSSDVGRAVGLHPDYANALFKRAFRMTLGEYLTTERVAFASRRLVTTKNSVTEIAFASGFGSLSRFNAAFRKTNCCTPREYRDRHRR